MTMDAKDVDIYPHRDVRGFAKYNKELMRDALRSIDHLFGDCFSTRRVATGCGVSPSSMVKHMHHLIYCGAIDVINIRPRQNNSSKYLYRRNFVFDDVENLLDKMQDNYERGVDYSVCFCRDEIL